MNHKDVRIGMKVVPFRKSVGYVGLEDSIVWRTAKERGYLYVLGERELIGKKVWSLGEPSERGGDYFMASDFNLHPDHRGYMLPELITQEYEELCHRNK